VPVCQAIPRLSRGLSQSTCHPAYAPFKPSDSEQRSHPPYYRGCWHGVSRCFLWGQSLAFQPLTAVYIPKDFILHAASLRQACAHCGIFVAAATRRCPGSVSVPMCRVMLSHPIPVVALVGRYPTNKLIGPGPLPGRRSFVRRAMRLREVIGYYRHFRKGVAPAAIPEPRVRYPGIPHPSATNQGSSYPNPRSVRLACLSHAASVRSEPGSNSSIKNRFHPQPSVDGRG
jgi:hypothetical protein